MFSQKNKTLPPFSICVSCIATPGLVSITSEKSQTNQQINSIICREDISPYIVFLSMKDYSDYIIRLGSGGTATLNLNTTDFSNIKFLVPNNKIMNKFNNIVKPLFEKILLNQKETSMTHGDTHEHENEGI